MERDTGAVLKNSRFLHIFRKNGVFCLLHSLTLKKVYGGGILEDLYNVFRQPMLVSEAISSFKSKYPYDFIKSTIEDLEDKGLLSSENEQDLENYLGLFQLGMDQYRIQHLYFIPTSCCNFTCKYCFVQDGIKPLKNSYLDIDSAKRALDLFAKLTENAPNISVIIYGGEPLLNAEVVYSAMHYIRHLEQSGQFTKPVSITLLTNGSLVDARTVESVLQTKSAISVSMDGPLDLHDAARRDIIGNGTFTKALSGFRMLQKAGANPSVSCTLNEYNVEHVEAITDFIINDLKPKAMGFNILLPIVGNKNGNHYDYELAAYQLIRAFKILRDQGIYEDRVMRRVRPFIEQRFHLKDCMGVGGQIVLTPEGRIGPCQAFLGLNEFFPLTLDELYSQRKSIDSECIYQNPMFQEWRHRFPLNMAECTDCFAIAVCGGGCPYASYVMHGSIWEIDERVCYQSKQIMEWMIWDTYDHLIEAKKESEESVSKLDGLLPK